MQNLKTMANTVNYLTEHNLLNLDALSEKRSEVKSRYDSSRERIKEIEKRLKNISEDIKNIDNYRRHKPVADKLESVVFKEKYKREHESELIVFSAAEKYLKKRFKGIYTDDTKTKGSNRYIKVPRDILDLLESYRKVQANEFLEIGDKYHETDRLFTKWDGRPMNPQTPYGWLKEYCEENDFLFYGIHTFRHLNASLLIGAGIDVATVSGTLGHSNQTTTLSVYSHMFQEYQVKACDAVANALKFNSAS